MISLKEQLLKLNKTKNTKQTKTTKTPTTIILFGTRAEQTEGKRLTSQLIEQFRMH